MKCVDNMGLALSGMAASYPQVTLRKADTRHDRQRPHTGVGDFVCVKLHAPHIMCATREKERERGIPHARVNNNILHVSRQAPSPHKFVL